MDLFENETLKCECMLDSSRGIYIPQNFAECYDMKQWGISKEDEEILLEGPDNEEYWETWDHVTQNAQYVDLDGLIWHLWQDGDLFGVVWNEDFEG